METVEIIKLSPTDWQLYKDIRLEALRNEPQAFGSSYAESVQRPDSFWQERVAGAAAENPAGQKNWLMFARLDGQIVGTIGAYLLEEDAAASDSGAPDAAAPDAGAPDTAEIIGVYVTPAARGKGIAAQLMDAIIREVAQSDPIRRLTLAVNMQQQAALALYRRFGFEITGKITARLGDGKIHTEYLMEKWIRR